MGECPVCGVPAMNGMSGLCDSPYCREQWEQERGENGTDDDGWACDDEGPSEGE